MSVEIVSWANGTDEHFEGIPIDEAHFPDSNFRSFVASTYDTNSDGYLSDDEIANATALTLNKSSTVNLEGIEYLDKLASISVVNVDMSAVNLSAFMELQSIRVQSEKSERKTWDFSQCSKLETATLVDVYASSVVESNPFKFPIGIKTIKIKCGYPWSGDTLSFDFDAASYTDLEILEIENNGNCYLVELTGVNNKSNLKSLKASFYTSAAIDVSNDTQLQILDLRNPSNTEGKIISLNIDNCESLENFQMHGFELSEPIDLSQSSNLTEIYITNYDKLPGLVLGTQPNLRILRAQNGSSHSCHLPNISITNCPLLKDLVSKVQPSRMNYESSGETMDYYRYILGSGDSQRWLEYDTVTTLITEDLPTIISQPQAVTVIEGNNATFSVSASGNDLSYQWEVSIDDGETWADIRGAAASSFSFAASLGSNGNKVRCKVTNSSGSVYSDVATLTVEEDTRLSAPVIDTQPSSVSVAEGSIASFSLSASGDNLNYRWQLNQNGTWYSISGATSASYSITASLALNGARYRCQVSNAAGSVYSTEATLSVTGGQSVTTPTVTSNPRSVTVEEGQLASFRVLATGGSLSYQWQVKRNNTWYAISGATSQILSIRAASDTNGSQYRCQVSNAAGVAYSTVATLTVSESTPLTFYGYHSIIISGKNTYGEWEMYPTSRPHVAPPEVKTSYVDVPGADGGLDYTELLNGKPNYGYRKGSWEFLLIPQEKWPDVYRSLCNFLHGREHTIILEDDPKWTYRGRLSVNEWRSAAHNSLITIDYILDPIATSTDDEGYDPDADDLDAAERLLRKPGNEDKAIILWQGAATIVEKDSLYEDGDNILY